MTNLIEGYREELTAIRRDIHRNPELAFEETRTSDIVAEQLQSYGIEIQRGLAKTGVVGTLKAGTANKSIALRADMDALPIQESNNFGHKSVHDKKMHACGHDGHTTMLLGAAKYLSATREFDGIVHFIFQPAEEGAGGARVMIEEGLFEKFAIAAVYGMHNWPLLGVGKFAMRSGPIMAAADTFDIVVTGKGTHAAMPHTGIDPVPIGAEIVSALQTLVSRTTDPLDSAVLSVTQFQAGDAYNVIPETATLRGGVRTLREDTRQAMEAAMERIVSGICDAHGARYEFTYTRGYPPTVNAEEETANAAAAAADVVGEDNVETDIAPVMGSEDFSYMLEKKPGSYIFIGNGDGEGSCMVHNPGYDFNDEVLTIGARYWSRLAETQLPK
ncbi:MAG: amidohydrolase [Proteobacteria bacterium]|nr:amidohydrolase [Pseudomonadota bacterium]